MAASTSQPGLGHTVYVFGPQFLSFTADSLTQLRSKSLQPSSVQEWVLKIFAELPRHWNIIATDLPFLKPLRGEEQLAHVIESIRSGQPSTSTGSSPLPNLVLCPLVVALQLAQYVRYRELSQSQNDEVWHQDTNNEAVGFCTGLLSALAVSSSTTRKQLEQYGAAAVRLAMLIGAFVDANEVSDKPGSQSVSLSAAWQTRDGRAQLDRVLQTFPQVRPPLSYCHPSQGE